MWRQQRAPPPTRPQEWDEARRAQDKKLELIEQGVVELGDIARTQGEPWLRLAVCVQAPVVLGGG
jgi:hypothetical protein